MVSELRKTLDDARAMMKLDKALVSALFKPAVESHALGPDPLGWQDSACAKPGQMLLEQLPLLSEFYQTVNPPLSSAIWSIWDSVSVMRQQKSLLARLIERRRTKNNFFIGLHSLLASAAIQFADGTAATVLHASPIDDVATYRGYAERAMALLAKVPIHEP